MGRILCLDTSNQRVPRSAAFRPSPTLLIHFSTILPSSPRPGPFLSPSTILLSRSLRDRSSFKRRRLQSPSFSLFSPRLTRASEEPRTFNVGSRVKISSSFVVAAATAAVGKEKEEEEEGECKMSVPNRPWSPQTNYDDGDAGDAS